MAAKVAEYLRHDPIKLRFITTHASNASPKAILKRSLNQSIAEIISPSYTSPTTTVILYEKLDVSIVELETKRSLKVIWTGIHNREESTHTFLLPKTSMVHELADHLSKQVTMSANGQGSGKIRVFEVSKDGKTQKEFTGSEMIGNIPDPVELYAEVKKHWLYCEFVHSLVLKEISLEEHYADDADKVISVFHFSKEVQRTHGVPFRFVVKPVSSLLRIRDRQWVELETRAKGLLIRRSGSKLESGHRTRISRGSDSH
jgi:ubiquitin carboxyl-terminal hydrolase 7